MEVVGRRVLVGGTPLQMRGVCYNPVARGGTHPQDLDFAGLAPLDIPLMQRLGVNVVRTYEPLTDRSVLDRFDRAGIRVIQSVYPYGGTPVEAVRDIVAAISDHPAILMWALGNEWNYNGLYVGLSLSESIERLAAVAASIRELDPAHPIATIHGELPSAETIAAMPMIDVWGINAYRGLGFGTLFDDFRALSDKPMFLAEYGADAYDALEGRYAPESQALAVTELSAALLASAASEDPAVFGGAVFEWADEWWKDPAGSPDTQEIGGVAPGGGPYPDGTFNEEWWGLVDIDRTPRPAYDQLQQLWAGQSAQ